jgi:hypothetical protein
MSTTDSVLLDTESDYYKKVNNFKIRKQSLTKSFLLKLLAERKSFTVFDVSDISGLVTELEGEIESLNMSCRIYTEYRASALAGEVLLGGVGLLAAVAIAAHNVATYNPDYEVGKNKLNRSISVTYKK